MIVSGSEYRLTPCVDRRRSRARNWYVPSDVGRNSTAREATPILQSLHPPPGTSLWMSYTKAEPGRSVATVIRNVSPTSPEGGEAFTGTQIVALIPGWTRHA